MITKSKAYFRVPSRRYLNYPIPGLRVSTGGICRRREVLKFTIFQRL
ncbi:MAG: hypothetical protein J7L71_03780 [Spirochaetaceae bacterium]|nr:hypothetical protein [Spirochaetaceae bacterium]